MCVCLCVVCVCVWCVCVCVVRGVVCNTVWQRCVVLYSIIYPAAPFSCLPLPVSSSNPLLPAVASLVVVVLLLITCVALLVLALAVTATKLKMLRAKNSLTDLPHYYSQTGGGDRQTTERIYDEVGEGTSPTRGQKGHYQELKLETMEKRQYQTLEGTTAKA